MPIDYQTLSVKDFSNGLDEQSSVDQLPEGFSESLINVNAHSHGYLEKRDGYRIKNGELPLSVKSYTQDGTSISITLDSSIDVLGIKRSPLILAGKVEGSTTEFPFPGTPYRRYPSFEPQAYNILPANTTTTLNIPASVSKLTTADVIVGIQVAPNTRLEGSLLEVTSIKIDVATFEIEIEATNGYDEDISIAVSYSERNVTPGSIFHTAVTTITPGSNTLNLPQSTHGLPYTAYVSRWYIDHGTYYEAILPESLTIASNGDLTIEFENPNTTDLDIFGIICVPEQTELGSASVGQIGEIKLEELSTKYPVLSSYTLDGANLVEILDDSSQVIYSEGNVLRSFYNTGNSDEIIFTSVICNEVKSNVLLLDALEGVDTVAATSALQLFCWGLVQPEIFQNGSNKITGVDIFRAELREDLLCAQLGNIFEAIDSEVVVIPDLSVSISSSGVTIGPGFVDIAATSIQAPDTFIQFQGVVNGSARATSISFNPATGLVHYKIPTISRSGNLLLNRNFLTVSDTGRGINSGKFQIISLITTQPDEIEIVVNNPNIVSNDYDEVDSGALVSINNCLLPVSGIPKLIVGDEITCSFTPKEYFEILSTLDGEVIIDGVLTETSIPNSTTFYTKRFSSIFPCKATSVLPVRHDMLSFNSSIFKTKNVVPSAWNFSVISIEDGVVQLDISAGLTTEYLTVGQKICITNLGDQSSCYEIEELVSLERFLLCDDGVNSLTGFTPQIINNTIELDKPVEVITDFREHNKFYGEGRWMPLSSPDRDIYYPTYLQRGDLPLRSTSANESIYFLNGEDQCITYDGTSLTVAGLPNWQLRGWLLAQALFIEDIPSPLPSDYSIGTWDIVSGASQVSRFSNPLDYARVQIGDIIYYQNTSTKVVGKDIVISGAVTYYYLYIDTPFSTSASAALFLKRNYRYYVRLELINRNNKIIVGSSSGMFDTQLISPGGRHIAFKCINPPKDLYRDYERMDIVLFRTKGNGDIYYEVNRQTIDFNDTYTILRDGFSDAEITDLDLTQLFYGPEAPSTLTPPPKAKYITSIDNSLILANIQSPFRIDLLFKRFLNLTSTTLVGLKLLLRKDNTDTLTTSDGFNRQAIEVMNITSFVTLTSSATVISNGVLNIPKVAHGLVEGQVVFLGVSSTTNKQFNYAELIGFHVVDSVVDTSNFTIKVPSNVLTGTTITGLQYLTATNPFDIPIVVIATTLFGDPIISSSSLIDLTISLALAINWSQSKYGGWIRAFSGNNYQFGQLILESDLPTVECKITGISSAIKIYGNSVLRSEGAEVGSESQLFPSRLCVSYPNYPEVFDNPYGRPGESDSIIDINPTDGQEITGVMPTFGTSTFQGSQKEKAVLVFKSNSVYLVDLESKRVVRLETGGLGCNAPYSPVPARSGISWLNTSGIYRLADDRTLEFIGRPLDLELDTTRVTEVYSHSQPLDKRILVSYYDIHGVRMTAVYNYDKEELEGKTGAWSYWKTADEPYGFCKTKSETYFGTSNGRVMVFVPKSKRDDESPIEAAAELRATDFGDAGIRKVLKSFMLHLQSTEDYRSENTEVYASYDLNKNFTRLDLFNNSVSSNNTNLYDDNDPKIRVIKFVTNTRKFNQVQIKIVNSALDESFRLSGLDYRVSGLNSQGLVEAKDTKS